MYRSLLNQKIATRQFGPQSSLLLSLESFATKNGLLEDIRHGSSEVHSAGYETQ